MSEPRPPYATAKNGPQPDRREPPAVSQLINRLEQLSTELERGMAARLQLVARVNELKDELQVERQACDHKEKERHALAQEADRLNSLVLDLTRQVELSRLSVESFVELDKLRREEIERLRSPKITIGGADVPVRLDPTLKPDEWHLRYPGASSYPGPDPRPIVECYCDLCNVSFGRRAGDVIECPACHGSGMNQRLVLK